MKAAATCIAASAIGGVLLCLSFAPASHGWIAWFALSPVFLVARGKGFLAGFLTGLGAAFAATVLALSGVAYPGRTGGGNPTWIVMGFTFFGFVLALTAGTIGEKSHAKWPIVGCAAFAIALESLMLFVLPVHLGLTQYENPAMMFVASVGGIWLVSGLVWASNIALAYAIASRSARLFAGIAAAILLLQIPLSHPKSDRESIVRIVQKESFEPAELENAVSPGADLVVLPEFSAIALAPAGDTKLLRRLAQSGSSFVVTFNDDAQPLPHNAASLFSEDGESARYFKRKLFGGETAMHRPGNSALAVNLGSHRLGLVVCFDSCWPAIMRETARLPGVDIVAVPSIDPPSPFGFMGAVHAAFIPFRAAELGVPIVKSDGYSDSIVVDASGRIVARLGQSDGATLTARVPFESRWTLYKVAGDWVLIACWAGLAWIGFRSVVTPKSAARVDH